MTDPTPTPPSKPYTDADVELLALAYAADVGENWDDPSAGPGRADAFHDDFRAWAARMLDALVAAGWRPPPREFERLLADPDEQFDRGGELLQAHMTDPIPAPAADTGSFAGWCILELLGHRRLAGYVRENQLAGHGFLRVDIPAAGTDPGRTQYVAPGSVYALHPVGEQTARRAATAWRPAPVQRWELPAAPNHPDAPDEDLDDDTAEEDPDDAHPL